MLEVCPTSFKVARKVGELLAKGKSGEEAPSLGGCGLIIDYGANHAFGNSLRVRSYVNLNAVLLNSLWFRHSEIIRLWMCSMNQGIRT